MVVLNWIWFFPYYYPLYEHGVSYIIKRNGFHGRFLFHPTLKGTQTRTDHTIPMNPTFLELSILELHIILNENSVVFI